MSDANDRLAHILDAIAEVAGEVAKGRGVYDTDKLVRVFVMYQLQVIGEAATRLPEPIRQAHSEIPWRQIIGMRHLLVHGYAQIDPDTVWEVARRDLPTLERQVRAILAETGE